MPCSGSLFFPKGSFSSQTPIQKIWEYLRYLLHEYEWKKQSDKKLTSSKLSVIPRVPCKTSAVPAGKSEIKVS